MTPMLQDAQSALHAASPESGMVAHLFWWMVGVGGAVWIATTVAMLIAAHRHKVAHGAPAAALSGAAGGAAGGDAGVLPYPELAPVGTDGEPRLRRTVVGLTIATVVILLSILVADFLVGRRLMYVADAPVDVDVAGYQWWWNFTYAGNNPQLRMTSANEMHVPVGTTIRLRLRAYDVIHSLWLPNMQGKRDMIPGQENFLQFRPDTAGVYRGQCAEFCGLQHAKMAFVVVAEPKDDYERWLAQQRQPADSATAANAEGFNVFLSRSCATCHAIRGTPAGGQVAPDLTHVASRRMLASGIIPNTPEHMARWIAAPDSIKPGTRMPSTPLSAAELRALVSYLETLK